MRYFAYGSNLNPSRSKAGLRHVAVASLPDHRLAFTRRSVNWKGGVLDVLHALGSAVRGVLYDVDNLDVLDTQEGVRSGAYRRVRVVVLLDDGSREFAFIYVVVSPEPFVPPSPEYLDLVRGAYRCLGFDPRPLDLAAAGAVSQTRPLFVYGTLLRGECRDALVRGAVVRPARARGRLLDLGSYPGLMRGDGWVQGELVELGDVDRTFARLDEVEGFRGWGVRGSLFERGFVEVDVPMCEPVPAWAWLWAGPEGVGRLIPCGSWRARHVRPTSDPTADAFRRLRAEVAAAGAEPRPLPSPDAVGNIHWRGQDVYVADGPVPEDRISWTHSSDPIAVTPHAAALAWLISGWGWDAPAAVDAVIAHHARNPTPTERETLVAAIDGMERASHEFPRVVRTTASFTCPAAAERGDVERLAARARAAAPAETHGGDHVDLDRPERSAEVAYEEDEFGHPIESDVEKSAWRPIGVAALPPAFREVADRLAGIVLDSEAEAFAAAVREHTVTQTGVDIWCEREWRLAYANARGGNSAAVILSWREHDDAGTLQRGATLEIGMVLPGGAVEACAYITSAGITGVTPTSHRRGT